MKRVIYSILILLFIVNHSFGQKKKIQHNPSYDKQIFHLGFTLGFNNLDYRITPTSDMLYSDLKDSVYGIECQSVLGINLGIISDLRLTEYLNLRFQPGMILGQRNLVYTMRDFSTPLAEFKSYQYVMKIPSIYLDVPISIKYRAKRINNYRPYIIGGVAMKYDMETKRVKNNNDDYIIKQDPLDFFYEFGFGIDFYLVYFKLSTELKFSFGLKDILQKEPIEYSSSIKDLKSKMVILSLHFE